MKRILLPLLFSLTASLCFGQEWFTSFDVAKRLALVQDKMLFAVWEDSFKYPVPLFTVAENGKVAVIDIAKDTSLDAVIWEYFIPVRLPEFEYENFIKNAKGRSESYINKLNDDSIKIMDVNGNILNVQDTSNNKMNLSVLASKYALNTEYLKSDLRNYSEEKSFLTSILLASRYVDFAIFADEQLRSEIIALGNIYLDESEKFLKEMNDEDKETYSQRIKLIRIKELLILDQSNKAYRQLKRIDENELDSKNEPLFAFLNYTVFKLLNDESKAELWKSKISSLNLRMAQIILKNEMDAKFN